MKQDFQHNKLFLVDYIDSKGISQYQEFYIPASQTFNMFDVVGTLVLSIKRRGGEISVITELLGKTYRELEALMNDEGIDKAMEYSRLIYMDEDLIRRMMAN